MPSAPDGRPPKCPRQRTVKKRRPAKGQDVVLRGRELSCGAPEGLPWLCDNPRGASPRCPSLALRARIAFGLFPGPTWRFLAPQPFLIGFGVLEVRINLFGEIFRVGQRGPEAL